MLIALYQDHHNLPFWHNPRQPKEVFDPARHGLLTIVTSDGAIALQDSFIWSVLMGLNAVNFPVMAHISLYCECEGPETRHFPKRIWVQITTIPGKKMNRISQ